MYPLDAVTNPSRSGRVTPVSTIHGAAVRGIGPRTDPRLGRRDRPEEFSPMSVDYFLKIDGIPGESGDAKHKDEIQVLSFSFGESQAGTMAFGGGGGAGKVQMQDFHFTMNVNKASPKLFLACADGSHIKNAVMVGRKAGKDQQDYIKVTFTDLLVTSFSTNGDANANSLPVDTITLNFAAIEIEYKQQNADGTLGAPVKVKYNLKEMVNK
jgi:type VI secretion system secreted protein Hcp